MKNCIGSESITTCVDLTDLSQKEITSSTKALDSYFFLVCIMNKFDRETILVYFKLNKFFLPREYQTMKIVY